MIRQPMGRMQCGLPTEKEGFPLMVPYFSVIVPIYKVEAYLRPCIDSILAQTFPDFELILVDDGSPDGCPVICDEYAGKDGRITVIHQENGGLIAAREAGLGIARAEYVCFVDSDDYVAENWLETIHGYAEANGRPDMLLYGFTHVYETRLEDSPLFPASGYYDKARMQKELYPGLLYDRTRPFFSKAIPSYLWAKIGKTDFIREHYVYDHRITMFEDGAMVYECIYCADSVYLCPECLYYYRDREQSIMTRYHADYISNLSVLMDYMCRHLGAVAPEMNTQISAYIVMRIIDAIAQEFLHGHRFSQIVPHIRRELDRARFPSKLCLTDLPLYVKIFVLLLKCHLYPLAILATRLRMGPGATA